MHKVTMLAVLLTGMLNAQAATVYTGDKIEGNPVISKLDVDDLEAGKVYRFMFQGTSNGIGQHWYVPVMVAKGAQPGPKLGLQAAVHGDELNGTRVIQQVFEKLDPAELKGSVIGAVGANPSGMLANNRNWQLANDRGIWSISTGFGRAKKKVTLPNNRLGCYGIICGRAMPPCSLICTHRAGVPNIPCSSMRITVTRR